MYDSMSFFFFGTTMYNSSNVNHKPYFIRKPKISIFKKSQRQLGLEIDVMTE